ncbi:MAG: quercetin dioxygenase-like cupin family protein [Gammaproteobacteria bacterium]|jgi:quercetin dioxygenase-like cupin family protein
MADADKKVHEHVAISMLKEGASSYVAGEQLDWIEAKPGVHIKWLYRSPDQAHRSGLFRLDAGARSAPHDHTELEQIYVMSGSFYDGTRLLSAGDHCVRPPGDVHSAFSEAGALGLLIYTPA